MTTDQVGLGPPENVKPASSRPVRAMTPLFLALGLGALAHALTDGAASHLGLNLAVWVAVFSVVSVWAVRRQGTPPTREGVTLLLVAFALAMTMSIWGLPPGLMLLTILALLLTLGLGAAYLRTPNLLDTGGWTLVGAAMTGGLRLVYGPFLLLERFPWARFKLSQHAQAGRWGVGVLLTLPVLAVFGVLLASADAGFSALLSGLLNWNLQGTVNHAVLLTFWCAFAGGLIYAAVVAARPTLFPATGGSPVQLGLIEVGLPLISLGALFAVFLLTQLPYYLSGTLPADLTFAQYIRKGFGELMIVAFLTLVLLLSAHAMTRPAARTTAAYRLLNLAVLAPLSLVILSAANRWHLYTLAYGLSEIRVLGAAFLVWVVAALLWLAYLLWRGDLRRFAYPALLLGLVTLLGTSMLNPAALIARTNLHRQTAAVTNDQRSTPQQADVWELLALGPDAVPLVIANLDLLAPACGVRQSCLRTDVLRSLHNAYDQPRDLRAWNASYVRAHGLVQKLPPVAMR